MIITTDEKYSQACDDKYMYVDYVSEDPSTTMTWRLTPLAQKNLPKVTAPGKLIYVDDGLYFYPDIL